MKNNTIEYARCMSKSECENFFSRLIASSNRKINSYTVTLEQNKSKLIEAYNKYALLTEENSKHVEKEFQEDYSAFVNKRCVCGSEVTYITGFNFYGCSNFKEKVRHKNFIDKENGPYKHRVEPSTSYITKILYDLDLKTILNAKALFNFYCELGFPDLSLKYNGQPYSKTINTYTNVKKAASEFEKKSVEYLKSIYPIVIPQFGILYKIAGKNEAKCFIDALCSNSKEVHIYECKTSKWDVDDEQKNLYISLINHIENKGREVNFSYLFEKKRN